MKPETCWPVVAFTGGYGYRFVAGPPARFPWNDFSKPDEASWIVFEVAPGKNWGGDEMGIKLMKGLERFVNEGERPSTHTARKVECDHGVSFRVEDGEKHLFTLYPRESCRLKDWDSQILANAMASYAR